MKTKDQLEKIWLGRRVKTYFGVKGEVIAVDTSADCPIRIEYDSGAKGQFGVHQLTLLKPKKKREVFEVECEWHRSSDGIMYPSGDYRFYDEFDGKKTKLRIEILE